MAASTGFIQSESAWLLRPGGGARKKMKGVMLLYPDKLAGVPVRAVATDPGNVTIIPLGAITALRTERFQGLGGLFGCENVVVTTADGTEYGFRGRIGYLQADIASALSRAGHQVRATPRGLAVIPHTASDGA